MILTDTNVISELWKIEPDAKVLGSIATQAVETLYQWAITVSELRLGLAVMPEGQRCSIYQDRLELEVLPVIMGRVLPIALSGLQATAALMARAKAAGGDQQRRWPHRCHGCRPCPNGGHARHFTLRGCRTPPSSIRGKREGEMLL